MVDVKYELESALSAWCAGYDKSAAFTGSGNAVEAGIIRLAAESVPKVSSMLYRGTGVDDGVAEGLVDGSLQELPASKRLLCSWTSDIEVARRFMQDAVDTNFSAVLIGVHSSRLEVVVDTGEYPDADHYGESEVLVLNKPLAVNADDILEAWAYDEDIEASRRIETEPAMASALG